MITENNSEIIEGFAEKLAAISATILCAVENDTYELLSWGSIATTIEVGLDTITHRDDIAERDYDDDAPSIRD